MVGGGGGGSGGGGMRGLVKDINRGFSVTLKVPL